MCVPVHMRTPLRSETTDAWVATEQWLRGRFAWAPGQTSLLAAVQSSRAFLPCRYKPQIQVTGRSNAAVYLSEGKLKITQGRWSDTYVAAWQGSSWGETLRRWNPCLRWLSRVPSTSAELWHFTRREDVASFSSFVSCSCSRSTGRLRLRSHYTLFETRRPVHLLLLTVHLPFQFTGFLMVCFHFMLMQGQTCLFNSTY